MSNNHPYRLVWSQDSHQPCQVTVCVSLCNCHTQIIKTLQSVYQQTQAYLDLVVVEDGSTDESLAVAKAWMMEHADRFSRIRLIQNREPTVLSMTRNIAVSISTTPYVFILDAGDLIYSRCIERCVEALDSDPKAAMAYPIVEKIEERMGSSSALIGNVVWSIEQFKKGNPIDAICMLRKDALIAVGGYSALSSGEMFSWEEYELWCKFIEQGFYGVPVAEILARCCSNRISMLGGSGHLGNIKKLNHEMMALHSWLELST